MKKTEEILITASAHRNQIEAISEDILVLPIDAIGIKSIRITNTLIKSNINNIGDLISKFDGLYNIKGLGINSIEIIKKDLENFLEQENLLGVQSLIQVYRAKDEPKWLFPPENLILPVNIVKIILPIIKSITHACNNMRSFKFLTYYYGLDGQSAYTLQEIGDAEGLSRERVRQINEKTLDQVRHVLLHGQSVKGYSIPAAIAQEAKDLFDLFKKQDHILSEQGIYEIVQKRYDFKMQLNEQPHLKMLLIIFGFKELNERPKKYYGTKIQAWQLSTDFDINKFYQIFSSVYSILVASNRPVSKFELKIQINKKRKLQIDDLYLVSTIQICPDIEIVSDDKYQIKFYCLTSVADQAYRVLLEIGQPMHFRQITKEINHRLAVYGLPASTYYRSLTGQMVVDKRFEPIGKSGKWKLAEWEHIHTKTTVEIMKEFLHLKNEPASVDEIHDYVIQKRPDIPKQSIVTYLYEKDAFMRVATAQYALSEWGHKSVAINMRKGNALDRLRAEINNIFANLPDKTILLVELIKELEARTNMIPSNIYSYIKRLGILDIEQDPERKNRKIAKYKTAHQTMHQPDKIPNRQTLMKIIQQEIESYLLQQASKRALLAEVVGYVIERTGCHKHTCYSYLSRMKNVRKEKTDNNWYCYLLELDPKGDNLIDFPKIQQISDMQLKDNILRAVKLLNLENIDIGLFQLGKIFEQELKSFLLLAQKTKSFPVSKTDLSRLVDMIECVVREKIIHKKHHLNFLREERNERAHGTIPAQAEREEMMRYAPFWGGLYIDYIVLFYEEENKLKH